MFKYTRIEMWPNVQCVNMFLFPAYTGISHLYIFYCILKPVQNHFQNIKQNTVLCTLWQGQVGKNCKIDITILHRSFLTKQNSFQRKLVDYIAFPFFARTLFL